MNIGCHIRSVLHQVPCLPGLQVLVDDAESHAAEEFTTPQGFRVPMREHHCASGTDATSLRPYVQGSHASGREARSFDDLSLGVEDSVGRGMSKGHSLNRLWRWQNFPGFCYMLHTKTSLS